MVGGRGGARGMEDDLLDIQVHIWMYMYMYMRIHTHTSTTNTTNKHRILTRPPPPQITTQQDELCFVQDLFAARLRALNEPLALYLLEHVVQVYI